MQHATNAFSAGTTAEEWAEGSSVKLIEIIFLPFHPVFQFLVLATSIIKIYLGPLTSTFNFVYCPKESLGIFRHVIYYYIYFGDIVYVVDTLLRIIHRQVEEEARKREYLPKSAFLILLDLFSVVPLYRMLTVSDCPAIQLWPNILGFNEILPIYRVVDYFSLLVTHSVWKLAVGYSITAFLVINAVTCLFLILTIEGLCDECNSKPYDWRSTLLLRYPDFNNSDNLLYLHGYQYVFGFMASHISDYLFPKTHTNMVFTSILMMFGYLILTYVLLPKCFAEAVLKLRHEYTFNQHAKKIIAETERRNLKSHKIMERYYSVLWNNWKGITVIPDVINSMPRHLILNIKQDLAWAVFYHSPTFRNTSISYKRWICEHITLEYRIEGERFFTGAQCYTNLYYLKSGVVQFFSFDDSASPILSVSSGTIFGDVCPLVPPLNRKVMVRCLTFCEVFVITRPTVLISLHKFPEDRRNIMRLVRNKINHARSLFACKKMKRDIDIVNNEEMAWIQKRWWEIANTIAHCKRSEREQKCELPPEEEFHCCKYLGQLVLCNEDQIKQKSTFVSHEFPLIIGDRSNVFTTWTSIVKVTTWAMLVLFPPSLVKSTFHEPAWFLVLLNCVDFIYFVDVFVLLFTAPEGQQSDTVTFVAILIHRLKSFSFTLDLLSTSWIDYIGHLVGVKKYSHILRFNRILKCHVLLGKRHYTSWTRKRKLIPKVLIDITLFHVLFLYVYGYFLFTILTLARQLSRGYFFFYHCFGRWSDTCKFKDQGIISLGTAYIFRMLYYVGNTSTSKTTFDAILEMIFVVVLYTLTLYRKTYYLGALFFKFKTKVDYQHFAHNLTWYYKKQKIHPDLMARLQRYLFCHWKYYRGIDVMHSNTLKDEKFIIYWKYHGEVAENIIRKSKLFQGANPALLRELAQKTKLLLLPQKAIMLLFGVQMYRINFLLKGVLKYEYHDETNTTVVQYDHESEPLAILSVLYGGASLKTYTAASDCEILYITRQDFFDTLNRYPDEASYIEVTLNEFKDDYSKLVRSLAKYNIEYHQDMKKKLVTKRNSSISQALASIKSTKRSWKDNIFTRTFKDYRSNPESDFIRFFMTIRMITAVVSIIYTVVRGCRLIKRLVSLVAFLSVIQCFDIILRLFVSCVLLHFWRTIEQRSEEEIPYFFPKPYYEKDGRIISSAKMCIKHYLTRSFITDVICLHPRLHLGIYILLGDSNESYLFTRVALASLQLYIILGWINYVSDKHSSNFAYLGVTKWMLFIMLVLLASAGYLYAICIHGFQVIGGTEIIDVENIKTQRCWVPAFVGIDLRPDYGQRVLVFLQGMILTLSFFLRTPSAIWNLDENTVQQQVFLCLLLGAVYWFISSQCQILLLLSFRGDSKFYNGVQQLKMFLHSERVPKDIIDRAVSYYQNLWVRNTGLDLRRILAKRIGVVFRQDLNYYFYENSQPTINYLPIYILCFLYLAAVFEYYSSEFLRTVNACSLLLGGDNAFERQFATHVVELHFLPEQEIMKELHLTPYIYVVHRGKVVISKDEKKVTTLTKGSIFGQMDSRVLRPVTVSAKALNYADVLQIRVNEFQSLLSTSLKKTILKNPKLQKDYLSVPKALTEDARDTINYLLRGKRNIKLPWMKEMVKYDESKWYYRFLLLSWLYVPVITYILAILIVCIVERDEERGVYYDPTTRLRLLFMLFIADIFFLVYMVSEFYTVHLAVVNNYCTYKYLKFTNLRNPWLYIDVLSLLVPYIGVIFDMWPLHLARLIRIRLLFNAQKHFCKSMDVKYLPIILRACVLVLILHTLTCLYIISICRHGYAKVFDVPHYILKMYDPKYYRLRNKRYGCSRFTAPYTFLNVSNFRGFISTRDWEHDYLQSFTLIVASFTHTNLDMVGARTFLTSISRICVTIVSSFIQLYISSMAISLTYSKLQQTYLYDYRVGNLLKYLRHHGISETLLETIQNYASHLWQRQKGCWLPEITKQAPQCLQEDIMESLYVHHLRIPPLFANLPPHFLRQLATRLSRIVVYPGKCIVQEGDIYPCIFFIHEGEVERWYTDEGGESRPSALLSMNDYFGMIPGLFPNTAYQFAYYSRTVCDLVYLNFEHWQDLLNGYPDIKYELYANVVKRRLEATLLYKESSTVISDESTK